MDTEETHPEAAAVLRDAGWAPHDVWGVYTRGPLVMGSPRAGEFRVKNIAQSPDGPNTPDDPVAAALWLVAHEPVAVVSEPEETPEHEAHEETGAEAGESAAPEGFDGAGEAGLHGAVDPDAGQPEDAIIDADFYESSPAIEGADLGAEILDEGQGSSAFIFGDNLPQMRTAAIGLVVQISLAKQDAIWAEAGAGPDEYSQLMSAVVRDTVDGTYRGDQATYDRFVALSTYDNAARRVQNAERERVTMLTTADRATIEGFDPQANWP
jgi:hypothetical protein